MKFWAEYWLFLHADETFGVLKVRPIGLKTINGIINYLDFNHHKSLSSSTIEELEYYKSFLYELDIEIPDDPISFRKSGKTYISQTWKNMVSILAETEHHHDLIEKIRTHLEIAIVRGDTNRISFFSRRLAGEISEYIPSAKWIFIKSRIGIMLSQNTSVLEEIIFTFKYKTTDRYEVNYDLSPVILNRKPKLNQSFAKIITEEIPSDQVINGGKYRVKSLSISIFGENAAFATANAMLVCRQALADLRMRENVRTHLVGKISTRYKEEISYFSLGGPFWTDSSDRQRRVPEFPTPFNDRRTFDSEEDKSRWTSAQHHVSTAIAIWPESDHHAASSVWQALESLHEGIKYRLLPYTASKYIPLACQQISTDLRIRIAKTQWNLDQSRRVTNWTKSPTLTDHEWRAAILNPRLSTYYGKWNTDFIPPVALGPSGILNTIFSKTGYCSHAQWINKRVQLDLQYLYGLRNLMVHEGSRILSDRFARYLGSLGLEILFSFAQNKASRVHTMSIQGVTVTAATGTIPQSEQIRSEGRRV